MPASDPRMLLTHSVWRKLLLLVIAIVSFVLAYEATMIDSRDAVRLEATPRASAAISPLVPAAPTANAVTPAAGRRVRFIASAYCQGAITASGVQPRTGIAASDPELLPVGSVVQIVSGRQYAGIYTIMDTGPAVRGRRIDLYLWSCTEAQRFGMRPVDLVVLRLGWNPRAVLPAFIDRLLGLEKHAEKAATEVAPAEKQVR